MHCQIALLLLLGLAVLHEVQSLRRSVLNSRRLRRTELSADADPGDADRRLYSDEELKLKKNQNFEVQLPPGMSNHIRLTESEKAVLKARDATKAVQQAEDGEEKEEEKKSDLDILRENMKKLVRR